MPGTDRHAGNALSQLPAHRRGVNQKPFGTHPRGPEVHTGGAHGRFGKRHAATGRFEGIASQRHSRLEARI